jgi:hypothetical protein
VLVVACEKCGCSGRYRIPRLAEQIGWDGKLTDWLYDLTKDCPRKQHCHPSGESEAHASIPASECSVKNAMDVNRLLNICRLCEALHTSPSGKALYLFLPTDEY